MLRSNVHTRVRPLTYTLTAKDSHQEDKEPAAALLSASSKQQKAWLRDMCTHVAVEMTVGFSALPKWRAPEGKRKSVFKRFSRSLMLFITSQQLRQGVAACNCGHRSFGPKTANQDGFLFPLRRLTVSESCDLEMGHYLTWTWSDVKEH